MLELYFYKNKEKYGSKFVVIYIDFDKQQKIIIFVETFM